MRGHVEEETWIFHYINPKSKYERISFPDTNSFVNIFLLKLNLRGSAYIFSQKLTLLSVVLC